MLAILLLSLCHNLKAESAFSLDLKTDIALGSLAVGLFVGSWLLENPPNQMPCSLSQSDVNAFDRLFMVPGFNPAIANIATATMVGMVGLSPVLPLLGNFSLNTAVTYGVMYSQAFLLTFATRNLIKNNLPRFRPYAYDGRDPHYLESYDHSSFPSGSTSMAFLAATFAGTTFSREHPNSRWRLPVVIGSYALAAGVGIMRMASGQHFITDVFAGAAIGSFYGWIIPFLHRNVAVNSFAIRYAGNGLSVSFRL